MRPAVFAVSMGILLLSYPSCRKAACEDTVLTPKFLGFDSTSLEVVKLSTYKKGSNFHELIDIRTCELSSLAAYNFKLTYYDTVNKFVKWPQHYTTGLFFSSDFDYLLEIPNASKVFRLYDIFQPQEVYKESALNLGELDRCYNTVRSFNLDGSVYETGGNSYTSNPHGFPVTFLR